MTAAQIWVQVSSAAGRLKVRHRYLLVALVVLLGVFSSCSVASAAITHKFEYKIENVGDRPTLTVGPVGPKETASEKSALFVANGSAVERYSAAGAPLPFTECSGLKCEHVVAGELTGFGHAGSVAVDDETGEIYVSDHNLGVVDVFSYKGEALGQITEVPESSGAAVTGGFEGVGGLAFDQSRGELYISAEGGVGVPDVVDVFKAEPGKAKYAGLQLSGSGLEAVGQGYQTVAVAEELGLGVEPGTVYVSYNGTGGYVVGVFDSIGTLESTWKGTKTYAGSFGAENQSPPSVGIDPGTDHVYVEDQTHGVVDEFGASVFEESLGRLTGTPAGPFSEPTAVAIAREGGDEYVGDYSEGTFTEPPAGTVDVYGPDLQIPEVIANGPTGVSPSSATLNGTVTLANEPATCEFVWGTSPAELSNVAPCEPQQIAVEVGEVSVHAKIGGLRFGTTYYYKLQATNTKNEQTNFGEEERAENFRTPGPNYGVVSVSNVAVSSATFHAPVDPDGAATSVFFEYGRCASLGACASTGYESSTAAEAIGSGTAVANIEQHVQGLTAGSVYHYRVAATSEIVPGEVKEFPGFEEGLFTTQSVGSPGLIDGRAYEMVSPPGKQGALIQGPAAPWGVTQAADTGGAFTFLTNFPTEDGVVGYSNSQQVFSTRTSTGWQSKDLATPHNGAVSASLESGQEYRFFSEDLSQAILQPLGAFQPCTNAEGAKQPCLSEAASEQTPFLRDDVTGTYTPLVTGCPEAGKPCEPAIQEDANVPAGTIFGQNSYIEDGGPCPPEKFCGPFFDGATANASHVVVNSARDLHLTGEPAPAGGLYEWNAEAAPAQQLQLVSVLPGSEGPETHFERGLGTLAEGGDGEDARHAISEDGSRVFWTAKNETLYMRDMPRRETIQIGGSELGGPVEGRYQLASADGSRVFYTELGGLFECEIPESPLECKPVRLGEAPAARGTGGELDASEDGSYVYWMAANNDLMEDHLVGGVWHPRVVAVLSSTGGGPTRVSPNGEWLAFMSDKPLTGYDNQDVASGERDEEAYLFSASSGRLSCASCNPTDARPVGVNSGEEGFETGLVDQYNYEGLRGWVSANLPGWVAFEKSGPARVRYQPRYLSNEGRLFFDSDDALVPRDINGTWDVYEYEPEGVPKESSSACSASSASGAVVYKPAHEYEVEGGKREEGAGCVGLISSGESAQESAFMDASESGNEVFFMTTSKLALQDFDQAYDVYDAHECTTASPCIPPPPGAAAECTTAEACRAAPNPEPGIYGAPPSATFNGLGNLTPAPAKPAVKKKAVKCAKGKTRNKHRVCVKKAKSKKAKKSNRRVK
jgi:hypothetical protein